MSNYLLVNAGAGVDFFYGFVKVLSLVILAHGAGCQFLLQL